MNIDGIRSKREKIAALAERGSGGEREVARRKLAQLDRELYDFGVELFADPEAWPPPGVAKVTKRARWKSFERVRPRSRWKT